MVYVVKWLCIHTHSCLLTVYGLHSTPGGGTAAGCAFWQSVMDEKHWRRWTSINKISLYANCEREEMCQWHDGKIKTGEMRAVATLWQEMW